MKRLVVLGLILGSFGLAACAVGVDGQGQGEKVDQQTNELDDQGAQPGSPGDDGQGASQPSAGVDLQPENLTYGGEPEGPTPHPWEVDDPNGPTPHPWGTGTSGGSGTGTNDSSGDDNTQGTSTHVNVY